MVDDVHVCCLTDFVHNIMYAYFTIIGGFGQYFLHLTEICKYDVYTNEEQQKTRTIPIT